MQLRILTIFVLAWSMSALAGEFAGLTPGRSTADDAKRALGQPTPRGQALSFPGDKFSASEILVQLDAASVIHSISIKPIDPPARADMLKWLNLGQPDSTQPVDGAELQTFLPQLLQLRIRDGRVIEMIHIAPQPPPTPRPVCNLVQPPVRPPNPAPPAPPTVATQLGLQTPAFLGFRTGGRSVTHVFDGTSAAQAGLREGDEIVEINSSLIVSSQQIRQTLAQVQAGQEVYLRVERNTQPIEIRLTSVDRDAFFKQASLPSDHLQAGLFLAERGSLSQAEQSFRKAVAKDPLRAQYELAQVVERVDYQRGLNEWRAFLSQADDRTPESWLTHAQEELKHLQDGLGGYLRMQEAMDQGKYDEGLLFYTLAHPVPVESSTYFFSRGYCLKHRKQYADAAKAFITASQLWLKDNTSWYHLSECLESYDLANCRLACTRYLQMTAGNDRQAKLRATVEQRLAGVEAALRSKDAGDRHAQAGRWQQALAEYEKAAASAPRSAQVLLCLARALAKLGRHAEAIQLCQKAPDLGNTPAAAAIQGLMGDIHFQAKRYSEAADVYGKAHEIARDTPLYLYKKAQAAEKAWPRPIAALAWQGYLAQSEDNPIETERRQHAQERLAQLEP